MSLMQRRRSDLDWPEWPFRGRLFDWPERWSEVLEGAELRVEEYQEDGTMVVRVEAPGIDPDRDVELTIDDHMLRIQVERREETRSEDTKGYRSEFRYGSFTRMVELPAGATEEDVTASYENGLLEIRLPVSPDKAEARKIPISHS